MPKTILAARTGIVLSAAYASLIMLAAPINTAVGKSRDPGHGSQSPSAGHRYQSGDQSGTDRER